MSFQYKISKIIHIRTFTILIADVCISNGGEITESSKKEKKKKYMRFFFLIYLPTHKYAHK